MSVCYTYTELTPKRSLQRILYVLSRRFSCIPHRHHSLPKEGVKYHVLLYTPPCSPSEQKLPSLLLWLLVLPNCCSPMSGTAQKTVGHLPSLLGLPRILLTSAFVGFCPSARMISPTWLRVILASPVLSKRRKASLKSAREEQHWARQLPIDKDVSLLSPGTVPLTPGELARGIFGP